MPIVLSLLSFLTLEYLTDMLHNRSNRDYAMLIGGLAIMVCLIIAVCSLLS